MRAAIDKQHVDFFKKNGWIHFEEVFSAEAIKNLKSLVDLGLTQRFTSEGRASAFQKAEEKFYWGRDLWRSSLELENFLKSPKLTNIIFELLSLNAMRVGFDQLLPFLDKERVAHKEGYYKFLNRENPLRELFCIKELVAVVFICLNGFSTDNDHLSMLPFKLGSISIAHPKTAANLKELFNNQNSQIYMIGYAAASAAYVNEQNDFHLNHLKKYGYSFNQKLSDKLNPALLRR